MKISSKGRYAVRIMAELSKNPNTFISASELSDKQNISIKFLEKIMSMLNKAKLIESSRGLMGGYKLKKEPREYSIAQILQATNDLPSLAPCLENGKVCLRKNVCNSIGCWEKLNDLITNYLKKISLEDLLNKNF